MTDAREIIALIRGAIAYPNKACGTALMDETLHDWQARAVSEALASAGIRILGPDEVDRVTVEKCAAVADNLSETWTNSRDAFQAVQEAAASDKAHEIAAAIRAIGREA